MHSCCSHQGGSPMALVMKRMERAVLLCPKSDNFGYFAKNILFASLNH